MKRTCWIILLFLPIRLFALDVLKELPKLSYLTTYEKIIFWTDQFKGLPYAKDGPLGEGPSGLFDQDPLYRFDVFDCTTFIETVTALAHSQTKDQFESKLVEIRYHDSKISYKTRNHITSQSWIPNNIENNYYSEATLDFSESFQEVAKSVIDLPNWYKKHTLSRLKLDGLSRRKQKKRLKVLKSLSKEVQSYDVELPYLSIKSLLSDWDSFTNKVEGIHIVNIVRPNWNLKNKIGTHLNISHQGFLIKEDSVLMMIHASTSGSIIKVKLKDYLGQFKSLSTIKGINLLRVNP